MNRKSPIPEEWACWRSRAWLTAAGGGLELATDVGVGVPGGDWSSTVSTVALHGLGLDLLSILELLEVLESGVRHERACVVGLHVTTVFRVPLLVDHDPIGHRRESIELLEQDAGLERGVEDADDGEHRGPATPAIALADRTDLHLRLVRLVPWVRGQLRDHLLDLVVLAAVADQVRPAYACPADTDAVTRIESLDGRGVVHG